MINWGKNKRLWRDLSSFENYLIETNNLVLSISKSELIPMDFLKIATSLDDIFQSYEKKCGPMEDPLFFFTFAQANALFLQVGKEYDELGPTRKAYIVNGFKEALTKHLLYPSFDEMILKSIDDTYMQFATDFDKTWFVQNRPKFFPFSTLQ